MTFQTLIPPYPRFGCSLLSIEKQTNNENVVEIFIKLITILCIYFPQNERYCNGNGGRKKKKDCFIHK